MKYIRIIITLVLFGGATSIHNMQAQEFSLIPSISIPMGDYSSHDLEKGAFAEPGYGFSFISRARSESWPDWLSVNFLLSYQSNGIDNPALAQEFNSQIGGGVLTAISKSRYNPLMFGLGPVYSRDLSGWLKLNLTSSFGVMYSNFDPVNIKVYDSQQALLLEQEFFFNTKPAFAFSAGAELAGSIASRIDVVLSGNFINSSVDVSTLNQINSAQNISSLNFGLGINYKF